MVQVLDEILADRHIELFDIDKVEVGQKDYLVQTKDLVRWRMQRNVKGSPQRLIVIDGKPVTTCTRRYRPLQHKEVYLLAMEALLENGKEPISVQASRPDEYRAVMEFMLEKEQPIFENDYYNVSLKVTNSLDLSMGIYVMMGFWRKSCRNDLCIWDKEHLLHTASFMGRQEELARKVGESVTVVLRSKDEAQRRLKRTIEFAAEHQNVTEVLRKLQIRKSEMEFLDHFGIRPIYKKDTRKGLDELIGVMLDKNKIKTEYDVLNALTNLAGRVGNLKRKFEIEMRVLSLIEKARFAR